MDRIKLLAHRFGLWFFCKMGDPIFSPSMAVFYGQATCLHCGKQHGTLAKINERNLEEVNDGRETDVD